MRSFQKKLVATAASAALVAIVGAAWAQSSDSSTAPISTGAQDTSQAPAVNNAVRDEGTVNNAAMPADTSSTPSSSTDSSTSSTDNSSTDSTPAPRADRN